MRRLIVITALTLVASCVIFLFSPLTFSSNAQDEKKPETDFINVEQTIGKKMPVDKIGIRRLKENTHDSAIISINEATGAAGFVRLARNKNSDLSALRDATDAREKSAAFFNEYASLFGIRNPDTELRYEKEFGGVTGEKHQSFQQFYNDVPVFAGMLKTHIDKENRLYAVNGTFVPEIEIDTNPAYNRQDAVAVAVAKVSEEKANDGLFAKKTDLYVYRTGLIKGVPGRDFLTWQVEVTNNGDVREFVFIDAHTNKVVDQFTGIHDAVSRRAYDGLSLPNVPPSYPFTPFWMEGQAFPTGSAEANNMLLASKETYNVFNNAFNRDSFNGAGATMDSIFRRGYSCPNASWNGTFISFCVGLTTDDITAHEWGHAYTEFTHDLIYQWQPGALNESYSDIFGEIVDRINNRDNIGNSAADPARTTGICSGSTRWRLGEDATAPGLTGALRDMYNPNCFSDPGKVSDAVYFCSPSDQGGVHTNSGVPNHAFALLVDGGAYNGKTINGIGLTKAAHIYFRAMNIYQNRDSDFVDHADSVEQSANDLRVSGNDLPDLQTGLPSGQVITASDFFEVQQTLLAVQMRTPPTQCGFAQILAKNPPAETACGIGATRTTIFANDFEGSTTDWTFGQEDTLPTFGLPDWVVATDLPSSQPGKAFYSANSNFGSCNAANDQKGVRFLKSPVIQIPAGTVTNPILSFDHWIAIENGYDGSQLTISVNGGAFTLVPQANFIYNAHNTTLRNAPDNNNPRASQFVWTGGDGGSVSGSWGKTMVDLTGLVNPGSTVQFRWDSSTDICAGTFGWYVDNVKVTACLTSVANSFEADVASRPSGDGSILSDDVVQVRRFSNTTHTPDQTTDEFQRADSAPFADRGDGKILSDDVVQARRYQNGTNPKQPVGGLMTQSFARTTVDSLVAKLSKTTSENAVLGNPREVRVENASGSAGQMVTVNIRVNAVGNESEYGFIISYDSSVLSMPVIGAGTAGASVRSCNIATAGTINCSVGGFPNNNPTSSDPGIGEIAAGNNQLLITVTFTVVANATPGATSLTLSNVNASSDMPQLFTPTATNGTVTILAPTAAAGEISGRVVTADGRGVFKARLTLTDRNGEEKTALTNSFGYYRFNEVAVGETYVIAVQHKRYVFVPQVINVNENIGELIITANR